MKVTKLHGKGNHLMVDGFASGNLSSVKFIESFLKELTKEVKMNAISKPLIIDHIAKEETESGITGTIILAESSITIHTYPNKNWFCLDIYSCKEFEVKNVLKYLNKKLKIDNCKTKLLKRGILE